MKRVISEVFNLLVDAVNTWDEDERIELINEAIKKLEGLL